MNPDPQSAGALSGNRIFLLVYSLGPGGAERAVVRWANHWARAADRVVVATLVGADHEPFYDLDDRVALLPLGAAQESRHVLQATINTARRVLAVRRSVRQENPDVVVSVMDRTNVLALVATAGLTVPVVVNERTYPGRHRIGKVWDILRRWTYPWANRLVTVSTGTLQWFPPAIRENGVVISNPVVVPDGEHREVERLKTVVGMGRLSREKGFDLLVRAFARCARRVPDWRLVIWGEGDQRERLTSMAEAAGVSDKVSLPGTTGEPFQELRRAGIFVLSSRYEGFPNVLLEAMGCGTPVISFRCPTGPEEIIRDGVDGLLVSEGDVEALAQAMTGLMGDRRRRRELGDRAVEVRRRFPPERELKLWDQVIASVTEPSG